MSAYFPEPTRTRLFGEIEADVFRLGDAADTVVMITTMPPGAAAPPHEHAEHQIGMCLSGSYRMRVGDEERRLDALRGAYWARGGEIHGAVNESDVPAVTLDIKRRPQPALEGRATPCPAEARFLDLSAPRTVKGGLELRFFVGPWFEIMLSVLEPGALMPRHAHRGAQIGIGLDGDYAMEVGEETRRFTRHRVYFAPDHVPHMGLNDTDAPATSLNVFIPPRWNLLPRRLRESADAAGEMELADAAR
ncbi:cupin domain-containing protein [Salinarimonas chemoclinalis]|uniref:cupin domain-containing protein n=1 Tax=Salinarimonas chemoclinalis TaxID=3241599 RepID=UPI003558126B